MPNTEPMQASHDSPRQRLRAATRSAHAALEARLPIAAGGLRLDDYRDHLRFLLGFHEPLETGLRDTEGLRDAVPDIDRRLKSAVLRADLADADNGRRASPAQVPAPRSAAQALGVLYVTEGATLGARTLLPRLRVAGVVPGPVGTRYMNGYGQASGAMWRRLCRTLDELSGDAAEESIDWANQTFARLLAWRSDWEERV